MKVFRGTGELPAFNRPVVTVGSFDGVHTAHRLLLDTVKQKAAETGGETVVVTFWPHPRFILEGESCPMRLLNSLEEKIILLREAGIDNVIVLPFTEEFSRTPHSEFRKWLQEDIGAKILVSGFNHHFGYRREGKTANLTGQPMNGDMEVCVVELMETEGEKISSSVIRGLIAKGKTGSAAKLLGYDYFIAGTLCAGNKGQQAIELRLCEEKKLLPPAGEYDVVINFVGETIDTCVTSTGIESSANLHKCLSGVSIPAILRITPESKLSVVPKNPMPQLPDSKEGSRRVIVSFAPGN